MPRRSIKRAQKLGTRPYDDGGDPEATWLWLDRVNKIYRVMGCIDDQTVLFSGFLMEDRAKDWWDSMDRRYPLVVCYGTSFSKSLLADSFLRVTRIRRLRSYLD